jgi:hypothetical protein
MGKVSMDDEQQRMDCNCICMQVLVMGGKVFVQRYTCVSGYLAHVHAEESSLTRWRNKSHMLLGETTCGVYNKMVGGWTGISFGSTLSTSFHRALTVTLIDLAVGVTAAAAIVSYSSQ